MAKRRATSHGKLMEREAPKSSEKPEGKDENWVDAIRREVAKVGGFDLPQFPRHLYKVRKAPNFE